MELLRLKKVSLASPEYNRSGSGKKQALTSFGEGVAEKAKDKLSSPRQDGCSAPELEQEGNIQELVGLLKYPVLMIY